MTMQTIVDIEHEVLVEPELILFLRDRLCKAVDILQRTGSELSVQLVSDHTIQKLHKDFMDDDTPTDVLSFEQDLPAKGTHGLLGDIVISVDTSIKQAIDKQWSLKEELLYLALHGLLHLLGYDHAEPEEEKEMFGLQHELFKSVFSS